MGERFGPGFQNARSRFYRAEYGALSITILVYLVWRTLNFGGVDWLQVIFWAVFPDVVTFIPIGLSSERSAWPSWGANLYNFFHTVLVWGLSFVGLWAAMGVVYWPLFGWLGHITTDRAVGYGLRATNKVQKQTISEVI